MLDKTALASLVGTSLMVLGCGGGDVAGTLGQLGEGVFRYECVEDGDPRCNATSAVDSLAVSADLGVDPELPKAIAVGARFDLTFLGDTVTDDGEFLFVDVEPARPDLVTHAGGFVIEVPGTFAFLARNGPKRIVTDFVHLDAEPVERLVVWHQQQTVEALTLEVDQTSTVAVVPTSERGVALAGALPVRWTSSDTDVVSISPISASGVTGGGEANVDEALIVSVGEGSATVTVTAGVATHAITVTVTPEPAQ